MKFIIGLLFTVLSLTGIAQNDSACIGKSDSTYTGEAFGEIGTFYVDTIRQGLGIFTMKDNAHFYSAKSLLKHGGMFRLCVTDFCKREDFERFVWVGKGFVDFGNKTLYNSFMAVKGDYVVTTFVADTTPRIKTIGGIGKPAGDLTSKKDTVCQHDFSVIGIYNDKMSKIDSVVCWKCGKTQAVKDTACKHEWTVPVPVGSYQTSQTYIKECVKCHQRMYGRKIVEVVWPDGTKEEIAQIFGS